MAADGPGLGVAWNAANDGVLAAGHQALISDPARYDRVGVLGVDEHVWMHTRHGDRYVTVSIDLRLGPGPHRPGPALGHGPGPVQGRVRSMAGRPRSSVAGQVEVVAMDGFTGLKTAATEAMTDRVAVMDPFHVVGLGGDALTCCRQWVQHNLHGHRGRRDGPLFRAWRTLQDRPGSAHRSPTHPPRAALRRRPTPDRRVGRLLLDELITTLTAGISAGPAELAELGRTLARRRADVLAYFDRPHTSNGPTEAINHRLEHLRGSALGFRNMANYIARSLLEAGGFRPQLHPGL